MKNENESPKSSAFNVPLLLFWLALFGGLAYHFHKQQDNVGLVCAAVLAVTCFAGYRIGAAKIVGVAVAIGVAFCFAPTLGAKIEPFAANWFGESSHWTNVGSVAAAGVLISMAVSIFVGFVATWSMKHCPVLAQLNKWCGFGIGGVEGIVAMLLLLGGIMEIEPLIKSRNASSGGNSGVSFVTDSVTSIAEQTRESDLGPYIEEYNPFTRYPELNQFKDLQKAFEESRRY